MKQPKKNWSSKASAKKCIIAPVSLGKKKLPAARRTACFQGAGELAPDSKVVKPKKD